jgi:RHS repeat-associated protein
MLYVTDYLGSVRAVVDGQSGEIYKASDYSAFGEEKDVVVPQHGIIPATQLATATLPDGTTIRDSYTGKEDQSHDFGTNYIDFGARQYNPSLRRWMIPDPLSEKYYGISPYAFCNNNPVNLVDPDGKYIDKASRREWNNNKRIIQERIDNLEYLASICEGVNNSSIVDGLNQQIAGIKQTLSTMKVIEQSEQGGLS